ncbi:PREDICTED: anoctamin-8-like [Priapulus caudatus]|uniref:Anoctamin n=1 Tax=Priapulus caudatus TaxID=37621 RepID=A0ABM1ER28_PRICU|nr:PREDICTED: anoctamin-8-like [Priapulus caudatus]
MKSLYFRHQLSEAKKFVEYSKHSSAWLHTTPTRDCDLMITFPLDTEDHTFMWLLARLRCRTPELIVHVRHHGNTGAFAFYFTMNSENLLKGAEVQRIRKRLKPEFGGGLKEFSYQDQMLFEGVEDMASFITSQERQSIILHMIYNLRATDGDELKHLAFRDGEAIAWYPLSLFGLQAMEDACFVIFAFVNVIWATLYLESWKRRSCELAYMWGTLDKEPDLLAEPRPLFKTWKLRNGTENYRLEKEYENQLIVKLFVFQFVNSFLSLFYIAFYIQDMERLREQLAALLYVITRQVIGNVREALVPYVIDKYKMARSSYELAEKAGHGGGDKCSPGSAPYRLLLVTVAIGYHCYWDVMEIIGVIAVIVNSALIGMSGQIHRMFPNLTRVGTIVLIVVLEHAILAMRYAITRAIHEVPGWVATEMAKMEFKRRQLIRIMESSISVDEDGEREAAGNPVATATDCDASGQQQPRPQRPTSLHPSRSRPQGEGRVCYSRSVCV